MALLRRIYHMVWFRTHPVHGFPDGECLYMTWATAWDLAGKHVGIVRECMMARWAKWWLWILGGLVALWLLAGLLLAVVAEVLGF